MTIPRLYLAAGIAVALVIVGLVVSSGVDGYARKKAIGAAATANQAKGEAHAASTEASKADAKVEARQPILIRDSEAVAQLRRELAVLRENRVQRPIPPEAIPALSDPPSPSLDVQPVGAGLAEVVAKQDFLIEALTKENGDLKAQVIDLTTARDHWKIAFEAEERRSTALEVVLKAQKSAATAQTWNTGIKGALGGLVVGYLARGH